MPLGILESSDEHVPGTTRYYDEPTRGRVATDEHAGLKHDTSGKVPIILIPQPSDDPNDPLNWPLWRRDLITFILCFAGILATALGSILAANTVTISFLFQRNFTDVALLTGYYLMGAGAAAVFFVPSARVWGKRHLFLVGICICLASSAWAGSTGTNYASLLWARIIQGVGAAPFESLLNAAVGDLYFVHQRGVRMAFTNLSVFGGAFFTPIVVGKMTATMGWKWSFYFVAIFLAPTLLAVFFFVPEMAYRRDVRLNTDTFAGDETVGTSNNSVENAATSYVSKNEQSGLIPGEATESMQMGYAPPKKSFVQSLALFTGRKTDERYWVLLLRPFPLLANPAFLWGCLIQGTMIGWTIFIGVIIAALFIGAPYFWSEVKAGYAYTGAFVGALGGFVVAGLLADSSVKFMTRRNNGVYEPEFRILLVIPMLIIGQIGLYGFALTSGRVITGEFSYIVPLVFFGFEVAGMVIGAVASSLYIIDAYRDLAIEGFTIMIIFKNFFSFALTFYAYDWIINGGIETTMIAIASVQVFICLLSVPMYIFGKRCRAFYHRNDLLAKCKLH